MIRILHTADLHLDSPLKSLALRDEDMRDRVQTATRTALVRIVDAALSENVSALLIAGDLFDGAARSAKTAAFLIQQLDRLGDAAIPVFYIKGNHDAENPITGEIDLPAHVHVFDGRGGKVQIADTNVWIHGVSFSGRHAPDSLLGKFGAPVPDAVNIGMLHTSLAGAAGHDTYAPCSVADLAKTGFDYWALGHIHTRRIYSTAPYIVMPGIPQGRDINEAGAQSATMLTIDAGAITIAEVPTSAVTFARHSIDVTGIETDSDLRNHLRQAVHDLAQGVTDDAGIVRLALTGQAARHWHILRDQALWDETIHTLARDTGRIWIDKISYDLQAPASDAANTATDELARIMAAIQSETGFTTTMQDEVDAILSDLPGNIRATLLPDPAALNTLSQQITHQGATQMLARMKGASD